MQSNQINGSTGPPISANSVPLMGAGLHSCHYSRTSNNQNSTNMNKQQLNQSQRQRMNDILDSHLNSNHGVHFSSGVSNSTSLYPGTVMQRDSVTYPPLSSVAEDISSFKQ